MTEKQWIKFPNSKVWRVEDGLVEGVTMVPNFLDHEDLDSRLDAISEAVTGSLAGLTDFSYQYRGNDLVSFSGKVAEMLDQEPDEISILDTSSDELRAALANQYGLDEGEVIHALDSLMQDGKFGEECVVGINDSMRELRCPAYPAPCNYVRVVVNGLELAYWDKAEWQRAPDVVMGAIIGAAREQSACPEPCVSSRKAAP